MNVHLAAALVVASMLAAHHSPSPVPVPVTGALAAEPLAFAPSSPLPGSPLEVTLTRTSESNVLTWLPPTHSGDSAIVGYAVLDGDSPRYVGADVTRLIVSSSSDIAVASINGSGCSVASRARPAAERVAQATRPRASR